MVSLLGECFSCVLLNYLLENMFWIKHGRRIHIHGRKLSSLVKFLIRFQSPFSPARSTCMFLNPGYSAPGSQLLTSWLAIDCNLIGWLLAIKKKTHPHFQTLLIGNAMCMQSLQCTSSTKPIYHSHSHQPKINESTYLNYTEAFLVRSHSRGVQGHAPLGKCSIYTANTCKFDPLRRI